MCLVPVGGVSSRLTGMCRSEEALKTHLPAEGHNLAVHAMTKHYVHHQLTTLTV